MTLASSPRIAGYRLPSSPKELAGNVLAVLTVEHGPWMIKGLAIFRDPYGRLFLKGPTMRNTEDRVLLRSGPERDAILAEAKKLVTSFLEPCTAAPPLATAPELEPIP